jgi:hypothetical protein
MPSKCHAQAAEEVTKFVAEQRCRLTRRSKLVWNKKAREFTEACVEGFRKEPVGTIQQSPFLELLLSAVRW